MIHTLLGEFSWPVTLLVLFEIVLALFLLPKRSRRGSTGKPLVEDVLRLAARPRGASRPLP